jgi:hypothetical protein
VAHPAPKLVVGLKRLGVDPKPTVHLPAAHYNALHAWLTDQRLCLGRIDAQQQAALAGSSSSYAIARELEPCPSCRTRTVYASPQRHSCPARTTHRQCLVSLGMDGDDVGGRPREGCDDVRYGSKGGLLLRVDPSETESLISEPPWQPHAASPLEARHG